MISDAVVKALEQFVRLENIHISEPMSCHTTFRVGGKADCMIEVENTEQLQGILHYLGLIQIPYIVLGNGSNVIVSDEGYEGIVIQIGNKMSHILVEGEYIRVQAGALLSQVAHIAWEHGLTGMEFASGIPGTVGGGVVMNAGAYGGEMSQIVQSVTVLSRDGEELILDNESMEFAYRYSTIKEHPFIVTEVVFRLEKGEADLIKSQMDELSLKRREKQPLEYPSAGSTFKRPEGHFAGELIMNAGLRGFQIGGARVSDKHCGFVVNAGNATAADVKEIVDRVHDCVKEKFGVELEPEIIFLGNFNEEKKVW